MTVVLGVPLALLVAHWLIDTAAENHHRDEVYRSIARPLPPRWRAPEREEE